MSKYVSVCVCVKTHLPFSYNSVNTQVLQPPILCVCFRKALMEGGPTSIDVAVTGPQSLIAQCGSAMFFFLFSFYHKRFRVSVSRSGVRRGLHVVMFALPLLASAAAGANEWRAAQQSMSGEGGSRVRRALGARGSFRFEECRGGADTLCVLTTNSLPPSLGLFLCLL